MGRVPILESLPSYATVCVAFYGGVLAPGAPMVPTPLKAVLIIISKAQIIDQKGIDLTPILVPYCNR